MFGATPDGVVSCDCGGNEILESKCPFPLRSMTMDELEWLVVDYGRVFRLNRSHKYFYQVQMFVSKRLYCDSMQSQSGISGCHERVCACIHRH